MLEGLEAVEIKLGDCLSIIDFRIDANTYKKDYIKTDRLIKALPHSSVEELSISVQNFGAYSLCNYIHFVDSGTPFLMTQNIRHNYIDWNIEKYVDEESHNLLVKSHCTKGQMLVTMAGEYLGRVAVYNKDFICSSNQAIAKVTFREGVNPYIISTFLNSRHGQNQINRLKTITGQPNINMSLIKSLAIPLFSRLLSSKIESLIQDSERLSFERENRYKEAETLLLSELGLTDFEPSKEAVSIKSLKESFLSSGRLDAEYYQGKYDDIETAIKKYPEWDSLNNLLIRIETGEYSTEYFHKGEIPNSTFYIRSTNIKGGQIELDDDYYVNQDEFTKIAKEKDIVTARVGSVGIFGEIREELEGAVYSDNILCFRLPDNLIPSVYTLLFNSKIYFELIDRLARGSVQQRLNQETLKDLIVPIIDIDVQQQIAAKIQESFVLKTQSNQLLEIAKRAVEMAIEEGEEKANLHILQKLVEISKPKLIVQINITEKLSVLDFSEENNVFMSGDIFPLINVREDEVYNCLEWAIPTAIAVVVGHFSSGFFGEMGKDAYSALKIGLKKLARKGRLINVTLVGTKPVDENNRQSKSFSIESRTLQGIHIKFLFDKDATIEEWESWIDKATALLEENYCRENSEIQQKIDALEQPISSPLFWTYDREIEEWLPYDMKKERRLRYEEHIRKEEGKQKQ